MENKEQAKAHNEYIKGVFETIHKAMFNPNELGMDKEERQRSHPDYALAPHQSVADLFQYKGNWPEDYEKENGNYENICSRCGNHFLGNKHRFVCKLCSTKTVKTVIMTQRSAIRNIYGDYWNGKGFSQVRIDDGMEKEILYFDNPEAILKALASASVLAACEVVVLYVQREITTL